MKQAAWYKSKEQTGIVAIFVALLLSAAFVLFETAIFSVSGAHVVFSWFSALALLFSMAALGLALRRMKAERVRKALALSKTTREIEMQRQAMDAHTMVLASDHRAVIVDLNSRFAETLDYRKSDLVGRSHADLWSQHDAPDQQRAALAALHGGRDWEGELCLMTKAGKRVVVRCSIVPLHDENGRHVKSLSLMSDVTALRKTEEQRGLTAMFEKLQDEIYIYDPDNLNIAYMNESALRRCGWSLEEARGKTITDTASYFDLKAFRAYTAPLMKGERDVVTIEARHDKGPVEISTQLCTGSDGAPVFLSVLRDISERKQAEKLKLETVSVVSHELRTPLTSIKGSLRLLQSGAAGPLGDQAAKFVDIAVRNSERLLLVVNDILDLEKINAGKMDFTLRPVNLADFLRDAVEANHGYAAESGVRFLADLPNFEAWANIDADRMMQVMSNLMSNAVKFSPRDGSVEIAVAEQGPMWRISVRDHGPGIAEKDRTRIFASFVQTEAVDGRKRSGTGLGLTITKKIVERHDGRIDVISKPGEGATFYVDLPKLARADGYRTSAA